jgi:hypothetical protein
MKVLLTLTISIGIPRLYVWRQAGVWDNQHTIMTTKAALIGSIADAIPLGRSNNVMMRAMVIVIITETGVTSNTPAPIITIFTIPTVVPIITPLKMPLAMEFITIVAGMIGIVLGSPPGLCGHKTIGIPKITGKLMQTLGLLKFLLLK